MKVIEKISEFFGKYMALIVLAVSGSASCLKCLSKK